MNWSQDELRKNQYHSLAVEEQLILAECKMQRVAEAPQVRRLSSWRLAVYRHHAVRNTGLTLGFPAFKPSSTPSELDSKGLSILLFIYRLILMERTVQALRNLDGLLVTLFSCMGEGTILSFCKRGKNTESGLTRGYGPCFARTFDPGRPSLFRL
jgi:hypothetical protein